MQQPIYWIVCVSTTQQQQQQQQQQTMKRAAEQQTEPVTEATQCRLASHEHYVVKECHALSLATNKHDAAIEFANYFLRFARASAAISGGARANSDFDSARVKPMACKAPPSTQITITGTGRTLIDQYGNCLVLINDAIGDETMLTDYIVAASGTRRIAGQTSYGTTPRREVFYSIDGVPYTYSGRRHETHAYPMHVLGVVPLLLERLHQFVPANRFRALSTGGDIVYTNEFRGGGSVQAHGDTEDARWGLVLIWTLGQTRWLRLRERTSGGGVARSRFVNVRMQHNSLVAMYGPSLGDTSMQRRWTHQVDKLPPSDSIGIRLSLNLRFYDCGCTEASSVGSGKQLSDVSARVLSTATTVAANLAAESRQASTSAATAVAFVMAAAEAAAAKRRKTDTAE